MFKKLSEHVYYRPAEHYTDRPNIGLVFGEKYALLFDAGNSAENAEKLKKEIAECGLPNPDFVAVSHWHWDHSFGLCAWNCVTIAGEKTNEKLEEVSKWKWDDSSMEKRIKSGKDIVFCSEMIKREYPDRSKINVIKADISFKNRMSIDLGGITCELIHCGGPHEADSVICYIPSEKIVFLGDSNSRDFYGKPWFFDIEHEEDFFYNISKIPYDKKLVEEYLSFMETIDFDTCISGHAEPMTKAELFSSFG